MVQIRQLHTRLEGRENQSFSQIVLHVFSGKFLKINRFEGIFSGHLKGGLSVFGLLAGFRVNQKRSTP